MSGAALAKPSFRRVPRRLALGAIVCAWLVAAPELSRAAGPPPLRVIVHLETADPFPAGGSGASLETREDRRAERIARIRSKLEARMHGSGTRILNRYADLPLVAMEIPHDAITLLATSDDVSVIEGDRLHAASLIESTIQIEATDVHALGFDGTGFHIAVLDTGVDAAHPMLAGRVDDEACFSQGNCPGGGNSAFGPGAAAPCSLGECYHGTHVAGIALGDSENLRGVAPGARLIPVQVFTELFEHPACPGGGDCALAYTSDIISGLDHIYQLRDTHQIAAANMSLGGGEFTSVFECDQQNLAMRTAITRLRDAGIATVVASGNEGYVNAMASPACISAAVSVGSVTKQGDVSFFSNSADFLDLLAPGSSIISAVPGTGYGIASGTSMATPHVAGAWALCLERNGPLAPDQVLADLQSTGIPILDGSNGLEHPLLQLQVNFAPEASGALFALLTTLGVAAARRRPRRNRVPGSHSV